MKNNNSSFLHLRLYFRDLFLLLFLLFFSLNFTNIQAQCDNTNANCPPIGEPFINDCFGGIEKYLARSANVEKMHTESQDYCDIIDDLVEVNAQYLVRAAGLWGSEHRLSGTTPESVDYISLCLSL